MIEILPPPKAAAPPFDYQTLNRIGQGAYGEVFLARDSAGNYWGVKVIYRASFQEDRPYEREFEGAGKYAPISLHSDHLLKIIHVGRRDHEKCFYYIMELADDMELGREIHPDRYRARTLKAIRAPGTRFNSREALRIALPLVRGLIDLHAAGLIHRDIKPANIIFINGDAKLADIGLVTDLDRSISFVGTDGFIPPEGPTTAQADIYALGKVIYEMISGRDRLDYPEMPTDLDQTPDRGRLLELNAVVAKACQPLPKNRYQTAADLAADLEFVGKGGSMRERAQNRKAFQRTLAIVSLLVASILIWFKATSFSLVLPSPTRSLTAEEKTGNFDLGRNLCFLQDDWLRGIPLLAKGADKGIATAALAEEKDSTNSTRFHRLAQLWIDAADGASGTNKNHCFRRARYWLRQLLNEGGGTLSESRRAELRAQLRRIPTPFAALEFTGASGVGEVIHIKRDQLRWISGTARGQHTVRGSGSGLLSFEFPNGIKTTHVSTPSETATVLPPEVDFATAQVVDVKLEGRTREFTVWTQELKENELIIDLHEIPGPRGGNRTGIFNFVVKITFGE